MPNVRVLQRSFAGGEISPEMVGRIDDVKYQTGLAKCRNFITKPHGPAVNRPGFQYVRAVKDSTKATRLIPFTFNTTDTMVLEFGHLYIRFHSLGRTLMTDGTLEYSPTSIKTPYEVVSPYASTDLFDIHYVQSADVLTLVHPGYAPRELRRSSVVSWAITTISFAAPSSAPTGVTATASSQSTPAATVETKWDYTYVVTAIAADGIGESAASSSSTVKSNLNQTGTVNTITWSAVTGATRYYVYKQQGGMYGYIGNTTTLSLIDDNIAPDMSRTPPTYDSVFGSSGNYPGAVSYYEQRRCLAGTTNQPQNIWMTKSGTESNMSYSLPIRDDDRIAVRVAAREANTIRHIVPLSQLVLLTSAAEWRVTSVNSDVITPTSISVKPQSYVGASNVQPEIINNQLVYCANRGGHIRELGYNWQSNGFITGDLSLRATHLFDNYTIADMCYSKAPMPLLWFISSTGKLLGLTYVPEQQIGAWHQHDTALGTFESCTVVSENKEDVLYVVTNRTINGSTVRYVERMASRIFADASDAVFVDCSATYDGVPADTISGLDFLEGCTVSILADGAVQPQQVVTGGSITLPVEASVVQIGLPIQADIETLPAVMQVEGFGQGRFKNVNKVWVRVDTSSSIWAGPDSSNLVEAKQRTTEPYGAPPDLQTREIQVVLKPSWNDSGQVYIRQANPLPISVLAVTLEIAVGG